MLKAGKQKETKEKKTGRRFPRLALVLGLIGLLIATACCIFTGVLGGIIAIAFGAAAVVLGIMAMIGSTGKGVGGIISGGLAIGFSLIFTSTTLSMTEVVHQQAIVAGEPKVAEYADTKLGLVGIFMNANRDNADMDEFMEQLTRVLEG